VILLATQIKFLPHHTATMTWLHRGLVIADILLIWAFWRPMMRLRLEEDERQWRRWPAAYWPIWPSIRAFIFGAAAVNSVTTIVFSVCVAVFPGEFMSRTWTIAGVEWRNIFPAALSRSVFEGEQILGRGRRSSPLSNTLVLPNEDFVALSQDDLSTTATSVFLENRRLESAVLTNVDLEKADLSGANLSGADLSNANLKGVDISCLDYREDVCTNFSRAILRNVNLEGIANFSKLRFVDTVFYGAKFSKDTRWERADLRGARFGPFEPDGRFIDVFRAPSLDVINLTRKANALLYSGVEFEMTRLDGADFRFAQLDHSVFFYTSLVGARFSCSALNVREEPSDGIIREFLEEGIAGFFFECVSLKGVKFLSANVSGSLFAGANLSDVDIGRSLFRGAVFLDVKWENLQSWASDFSGAAFDQVVLTASPSLADVDFKNVLDHTVFTNIYAKEASDRDVPFSQRAAQGVPMEKVLEILKGLSAEAPRVGTTDNSQLDTARWKNRVRFLYEEACKEQDMLVGLIRNGQIENTGNYRPALVAEILNDPTCQSLSGLVRDYKEILEFWESECRQKAFAVPGFIHSPPISESCEPTAADATPPPQSVQAQP
ncbi:MAG: pentapeptide repeat-containing protein, partial [Pseudomonadota bacterium]